MVPGGATEALGLDAGRGRRALSSAERASFRHPAYANSLVAGMRNGQLVEALAGMASMKSFGYTTYWVNRFNLPKEELGIKPDATSNNLEGLMKLVLGKP
jgi:hypothetical protein